MRLEFLRDWPPYRPGQVADYPHDGAADVLIRRGLARPAPVAEAAAETPPEAPAPPPKSKKGK